MDLSELRYLDSSGLEILFDLRRRLESRRQELRIEVAPDSPVRRALELVGLVDPAAVAARAEPA